MTERVLENYLTGLKTSLTDDAGEHPEAVAVASVMVIDALGDNPAHRQITIQAKVFHNQSVFDRCGKALQIGGSETIQQQVTGDGYAAELDAAPLTMLVLSRHLQRKMRPMIIGRDDDGNPVTLENAVPVPVPEYLNSPDVQNFLQQFDAIEAQMAAQLQILNNAGGNDENNNSEISRSAE